MISVLCNLFIFCHHLDLLEVHMESNCFPSFSSGSDGYLVQESKVGSKCAGCTLVVAPCQGIKSRLNMLASMDVRL